MNDTIAAIATGPVRCAIGVIRISGPMAIAAASAVFTPSSGGRLEDCPERILTYGVLRDREGIIIDRPLSVINRAPRSYTGEDTAELHCHGSPTVLALALESLYAKGVRPAKAGEFTRRAFLNGKLDLAQAEAVADLIDAESVSGVRQAAGQLGGALSRRVETIYNNLVDLMAHFHAALDYPDEDIDPLGAAEISSTLDTTQRELSTLLETYDRGRFISQGVPCAIVGRPNAGKSSLLNALLGYDRAIVTPIPGTTRDTVEERLRLGGVLLRLIDTAGLRNTYDQVEQLGVERSRAAVEGAQLVLVILDLHQPYGSEDEEALQLGIAAPRCIVVSNKSDLPSTQDTPIPVLSLPESVPLVEVSALTGDGLDKLELAIEALFQKDSPNQAGDLLTNARQAEAASRSTAALARASHALAAGITPDAVLTDVEEALSALGELTGRTLREDVVGRIFERFCVGK